MHFFFKSELKENKKNLKKKKKKKKKTLRRSDPRLVRRATKVVRNIHVWGSVAPLRHELERPPGQEVPSSHREPPRAFPQPGRDSPARRLQRREPIWPEPLFRAPVLADKNHLHPRQGVHQAWPPRHLQRLPPRLADLRRPRQAQNLLNGTKNSDFYLTDSWLWFLCFDFRKGCFDFRGRGTSFP